MFEVITDVPEKIRKFYEVETHRELTGGTISVPYTYQDESGKDVHGTRNEPEYADVDYVVLRKRPECRSIADVWAVVKHQRGNGDPVIRKFIGFVNNSLEWDYHDEYLAWYEREPMPDDDEFYVYENENIDDSMIYSQPLFNAAHQRWQAEEPRKPAKIDIDQWFLDNARQLRRYCYKPFHEQAEMLYDDTINGTTKGIDHNRSVKAQYPLS